MPCRTPRTSDIPAGLPPVSAHRNGQPSLALVALPGLAGLIVLTFSGGVIGYRQANAGRYLLTERAARFLR